MASESAGAWARGTVGLGGQTLRTEAASAPRRMVPWPSPLELASDNDMFGGTSKGDRLDKTRKSEDDLVRRSFAVESLWGLL